MQKTRNNRRIASHYLHTPKGLLKNGIVTIDPEGFITDIDTSSRVDSLAGVEFFGGILLPGLVNAHCHLELSYLVGCIEPQGGFPSFAAGMRAAREKFPVSDRIAAARYQSQKMWAEGISVVGDISNSDITFEIKQSGNICYHTFAEVYGLNTIDIAQIEALRNEATAKGLSVSVSPHSTYSLNEKLFREAVGSKGILSIHFMESNDEQLLYEGRGGLKNWFDQCGLVTDFTGKYSGPADRIIKNIAPDRKILLIHNTAIREKDIECLNGHFGDNLTYVLCPRSNEYITGALPPIELLAVSGCRIAVGTDSLASNHSLSLIDELKMFPEISLETSLDWITINGATALAVEERMGSLEVGKQPGLVLLENIDMGSMRITGESSTRRIA